MKRIPVLIAVMVGCGSSVAPGASAPTTTPTPKGAASRAVHDTAKSSIGNIKARESAVTRTPATPAAAPTPTPDPSAKK
jgi:hypothetical protein